MEISLDEQRCHWKLVWHLGVHMVGVLLHGRHPICFLDYHQFPHDSNLMINPLLQVSYHMVFYPFVLVLHKERSHFYIKYFTLRRAFFVIQKSASFLIPKKLSGWSLVKFPLQPLGISQ